MASEKEAWRSPYLPVPRTIHSGKLLFYTERLTAGLAFSLNQRAPRHLSLGCRARIDRSARPQVPGTLPPDDRSPERRDADPAVFRNAALSRRGLGQGISQPEGTRGALLHLCGSLPKSRRLVGRDHGTGTAFGDGARGFQETTSRWQSCRRDESLQPSRRSDLRQEAMLRPMLGPAGYASWLTRPPCNPDAA